jgi:hypothetical protein
MKIRGAAFTLVELVVVAGLLVVLAGGLSLAFRREGNGGIALKAAETGVAAMLGQARSRAVSGQLPTRFLVLAAVPTGDPGVELRRMRIVQQVAGVWSQLGPDELLPENVGIVPPEPEPARIRAGVSWDPGLVSQLDGPVVLAAEVGGEFFLEFTPQGRPLGGSRRIVLALADAAPGRTARLVDPLATRVIGISAAGGLTKEDAP